MCATRSNNHRVPVKQVLELIDEVQFCARPSALLSQAGIAYTYSELTSKEGASITNNQASKLYKACMDALEAHLSRNSGRIPVSQDEFDLLWRCVVTCSTLKEAIVTAKTFCQMLRGSLGRLELHCVGDNAEFHMDTLRSEITRSSFISDMIGLTMFYRMFSWLIGSSIPLLDVSVLHLSSATSPLTRSLLPFPIQFQSSYTGFRFPESYLKKPVVQTPQELKKIMPVTVFRSVVQLTAQGDFATRVKLLFRHALASESQLPTSIDLASILGCSEATLRRKLKREGHSLQGLKTLCKKERAIDLLTYNTSTIEEIASKLRFSDASAFQHAFKNWTGQSPGEYRLLALKREKSNENTPLINA